MYFFSRLFVWRHLVLYYVFFSLSIPFLNFLCYFFEHFLSKRKISNLDVFHLSFYFITNYNFIQLLVLSNTYYILTYSCSDVNIFFNFFCVNFYLFTSSFMVLLDTSFILSHFVILCQAFFKFFSRNFMPNFYYIYLIWNQYFLSP